MEKDIVLGITKLAKRLDVTVPTIYNYIKKGLPFHQIKGKKVFEMNEIYEWLTKK